MARLATTGFEVQKLASSAANDPEGQGGVINLGTPTIDTSTFRSGLAALKCAATGSGQGFTVTTFTGALDRDYFARAYIQISNNTPTQTVNVMELYDSGVTDSLRVVVAANTKNLILWDSAGSQIGAGSFTMTAGVWYRVEMRAKVKTGGGANSTAELKVDGATIVTSTTANLGSTAIDSFDCNAGAASSPGTLNVFFDDVALNDDQGASQNSYPGAGTVVLLKPTSDSARTGFTGGAGGTTNLFDAVNNYPATGVITTGTNATQIGSATNNATDNYQPNLGAYSTAVASGGGGMTANDTVTLVQALARGGNSTTTSRNFGIQSVSNPAITEVTQATGTTAAGTETTGWTTKRTAVTYAPSVTAGTSPVLEFRKATASTNNLMCDLMGMYVEFSSVTPVPLNASALAFSDSLAVNAPTQVPLNTSALAFADSVALHAPTQIALNASALSSSATVALTAPTQVPLGTSALSVSTLAALTAATQIPLDTADLTFSDILALSAPTQLPLGASGLLFATDLAVSITSLTEGFTFGPGIFHRFPEGTLVGLYESVDAEDPPLLRKTGEPPRDPIAEYTVTEPFVLSGLTAGRRYFIAAEVPFEEKKPYFVLTHHEWRYLYFVP